MSIRIQNDGIASLAASQAAQLESVTQPGGSTQADSVTHGGADQVAISSLSGNIAASAAALAGQQTARVNQLAALYAKGAYQPDSLETSRAMVSAALAAGSMEEDG